MAVRHLGINAVFLAPRLGGLETYVRELVPELLRARPGLQITIFVSPLGLPVLAPEPWAGQVRFATHPLFRPGLKAVSELTVLGALAPRRGVEVLHSIALTGPLRSGCAHVVTIADLTWMHTTERSSRFTYELWRRVVPPVARHAERVIAIAQDGAADIAQNLGVPPERIDVTLLGFGNAARNEATPEPEIRRRFALGTGRVVLTVGGKRVHKNLHRLVEAWPAIRAAHPDATLVLAGKTSPYEDEVRAVADRLAVTDSIRFLDYVEDADLEGLYATADLFVLPSTHEGFGLPVVEAQARGVPVACSSVSSVPEAAGEGAAFFDPYVPADIARAVLGVLGDAAEAERLVAAGRANVGHLTWRATAEATLESYDRALDERRAARAARPVT